MKSLRWIVLIALPAAADDWSHLGRDDARSRAPAETIVSPAALATLSTGAETAASPVAADGVLVLAGLDGRLRAFREGDLAPLWTSPPGAPLVGTPLLDRGRIFATRTDGTLSARRLADGLPLWTSSTSGADQASPILAGGRLVFGSGFPNTSALAVEASSGATAWEAELDQLSASAAARDGGRVYVNSNSGRLHALDETSGAAVWTYDAGGAPGPSSPMADGGAVYVVADAALHRVDVDPADWGTSNWILPAPDPAPPAGALGVESAASSPAKAGSLVVFAVRFTYAMNLDGDPYGYPDARRLREFAVAVDPAGPSLAWQVLLGDATVANVNGIPPFQLVPSPAWTGAGAAFASSVAPSLRILATADGSDLASLALDAPSLASPTIANARIYAVSRAGTLYAFQGTNVPPPAPGGLSPAGGADIGSAPAFFAWNAAEVGATYTVRADDDGEVLTDWDVELFSATTSVAFPALPPGAYYTWGVRARDVDGAQGPWALATFGLGLPAQPPGSLAAAPLHEKVILTWTPSPSSGVTGYRLQFGPLGGAQGPPLDLGTVTTAVVEGLANGQPYLFELRTVRLDTDASLPASVASTPVALMSIGAATFDSLQTAFAAALSGDVVNLGADTFTLTGTAALPDGVTLRGVNAHVTRILAADRSVMIAAAGAGAVERVTLAGGSIGVRVDGAGLVVQNCVIRDMSDAGVEVNGSAEILSDTIVRNGTAGVRAAGAALVRNAIVQENGVGLSGGTTSTYSVVADGYDGTLGGAGDSTDPVSFLDPSSGDYREAAGQPSLDTGDPVDAFALEPAPNGGRINRGAFGNTELAAPTPPAAGNSSGSGCSASAVGSAPAWALLLLLAFAMRRRR